MRGRYAGTLIRFGVGAVVVAACHRPAAPGPVVATVAPAPTTDTANVAPRAEPTTEGRLEFRFADSVAFEGSERKPRLFEEQRVFAAVEPVVGSADFRSVEAAISEHGMPVLNLELCADAGERLARLTADRVGGRLMILAGNEVLSVAVITGPFGARVQVTGLGTMMKTMAFARVMRTRLQQPPCAR